MTAEEQIKRITGLLNDLCLDDLCYEEYEKEFMKATINDLKDELWIMYCFANDVCDTLNM